MRKDRAGYIVVETIGGFMLFLFLVISILSLVNIAALQARVHYALSQTAEQVSIHSYISEHSEAGSAPQVEYFTDTINGFFGGTLSPAEVSAALRLSSEIDDGSLRDIFERYMTHAGEDVDVYLQNAGIEDGMSGFDFSGSTLMDENDEITLVVEYELNYSFGALPLPFAKLTAVQTAKTKSWRKGNGKGYDYYFGGGGG